MCIRDSSTIDATKFIGAGYYHDGDAWDLLSDKAPITNCLPIVTVLTLSATGSEMDAGGVISLSLIHISSCRASAASSTT